MNELDAMVDESGRWGKLSKYHPITLMFRDQSKPVNPHIERYEQHLADVSLPDIPFHAGPLFNGHDDYEIGAADIFLEIITQPFPGFDGIVPGSSNQATV